MEGKKKKLQRNKKSQVSRFGEDTSPRSSRNAPTNKFRVRIPDRVRGSGWGRE